MPTTTNWTETQIKTAARNIARKAKALRKNGRHEEADAMVAEAVAEVARIRAAGRVAA